MPLREQEKVMKQTMTPRFIYGPLAQLVEQLAVNQWVVGSSPTRTAIKSIDYVSSKST